MLSCLGQRSDTISDVDLSGSRVRYDVDLSVSEVVVT